MHRHVETNTLESARCLEAISRCHALWLRLEVVFFISFGAFYFNLYEFCLARLNLTSFFFISLLHHLIFITVIIHSAKHVGPHWEKHFFSTGEPVCPVYLGGCCVGVHMWVRKRRFVIFAANMLIVKCSCILLKAGSRSHPGSFL